MNLSIETPRDFVQVLSRSGAIAPSKSLCEVFQNNISGVQCLICTSQVVREAVAVAAFALSGICVQDRKAIVAKIGDLIRMTGLKIPKTMVSTGEKFTVLMVPWLYRGEFRAFIASAIAFHPTRAPEGGKESLPGNVSASCGHTRIDHNQLDSVLVDFVENYDGVLLRMLKNTFRSKASGYENTWELPLRCTVQEHISSEGVSWDICFRDVDVLERASNFVDARMASSKVRLLAPASRALSEEVETTISGILISSGQNSHQARIEMAGVLRHVLTSLDCLDFRSDVNHQVVSQLFA